MAIQLPSGVWVETGVPAESKTHALVESLAHQRRNQPPVYVMNPSFQVGWSSLWTLPTPTDGVHPSFDAALFHVNSWQQTDSLLEDSWPALDQNITDAFGWELLSPNPNTSLIVDTGATWSADATGEPYQLANGPYAGGPKGASYSPLYAYCFNFGANVKMGWSEWMNPVNLVNADLLLSDDSLLSINQIGMNSDFSGTLTFGPIVLNFSRASGWSGTGVSGNAFSSIGGPSGSGQWDAKLTYNFTNPWQISLAMGPLNVSGSGGTKQGGGSIVYQFG
jgi:hypothetical protein